MLIPIRCFTCGKVLADKYDFYVRKVEALKGERDHKKDKAKDTYKAKGKEKAATAPPYFDAVKTDGIMDSMGLTRYCCRRHMLGTVDMMETI